MKSFLSTSIALITIDLSINFAFALLLSLSNLLAFADTLYLSIMSDITL